MKIRVLALSALVLGLVAATGSAAAQTNTSSPTFITQLLGSNEPSQPDTNASGVAGVVLSSDGSTMYYSLTVTGMSAPLTMAHIHLGPIGVNGPIVVGLCTPDTTPCATEGEVASGTFTEADFVGPLAGASLADLMDQIRQGNAYVNVHSTQYPGGEARGQLVELLTVPTTAP